MGLCEVLCDLFSVAEHLGSSPPPQPLGLGPRVCMTTRPPRRTGRLGSGSHAHFGSSESAGAEANRRRSGKSQVMGWMGWTGGG